jgi:hypothetical protein
MNITKFLLSSLLAFGLLVSTAESRSKRVNQIPNGSVFRCANCHIDPSGGGTRTSFGKVIEANYLNSSGNVTWNQALALNDADGDGVPNGAELLDPTGAWAIGVSNPGIPGLVSNPGDPNSITKVGPVNGASIPLFFSLDQNYPNPFNPTTTIYFDVAKVGKVHIRIFNSVGQVVRTLANESFGPGRYQAQWNGLDDFGQSLSSGLYLYRLDAQNFSTTKRMTLLK